VSHLGRCAAVIALLLAGAAVARATPAAPRRAAVRAADLDRQPPDAPPYPSDLAARLARAWAARPAGYVPRTRHLRPDGSPRYVNRLFLESSPYLRQHAHNPVDWYPWGDEAFAAARRLGRPIFLSIGYATCHWCHVMEEESFEDDEIARFINQHYIAIKVDREERPDVDAVYLRALEQLTGGAGWPANLWLTPDGQPFYGGTYFPPRDGGRGAGEGLLTALHRLQAAYASAPQGLASTAAALAAAVRDSFATAPAASATAAAAARAGWLADAVRLARTRFDPAHGGERGAPKFPADLPLRLLLREGQRTQDSTLTGIATLTLERMAAGGIHDLLGGGFHRYSVDDAWRVPHYEKTLYDQALLATTYLEAAQATGRRDFAQVASTTLDFAIRELGRDDGGFASALDADSLGPDRRRAEGAFYTWSAAEIDAALGSAAAAFRAAHPTAPVPGGRLVLLGGADSVAPELEARWRQRLLAARARRARPERDDKAVVSWNGLMISALSRAARTLDRPDYAARAGRAAEAILTAKRRDKRLPHTIAGNGAAAFLSDYAFLVAGLLDLYEATGEVRWFAAAQDLDRDLARDFEDPAGGYFLTARDASPPLVRTKPIEDGAEPSGNSVQAMNLLRFLAFTGDDRYRQRAERLLQAAAGALADSPQTCGDLLLAVEMALAPPPEVVLVAARRAELAPFLAALRGTYAPRAVTSALIAGEIAETARAIPLVEGKIAQGGLPTAYVCRGFVCRQPTHDPAELVRQLAEP